MKKISGKIDMDYWNHAKSMLGVHGNRVADEQMFEAVMRKYAQLKSGIYVKGEKLPIIKKAKGTMVKNINVDGIPALIKVKEKL